MVCYAGNCRAEKWSCVMGNLEIVPDTLNSPMTSHEVMAV